MNKKALIFSSLILGLLIIGGIGFSLINKQEPAKDARPIATTMAQVAVFDRLGVDLVAVPSSEQTLPARYAKLPKVGNHISINFEQIINAKPSVVYVDSEVTDDYAVKLKQEHIKMQALNFDNYQQLQATIKQLGATYHKSKQAQVLLSAIKLPNLHVKKHVKVLVLMGMPGGAFLVANNQSYIGDLVKRAGGDVVASDPHSIYTPANPQVIAQANPDVVIRLAHAMPASVKQDFKQTFAQAPYNNLKATHTGQIYDVAAPEFALNANLQVVTAYRQIYQWLEAAA